MGDRTNFPAKNNFCLPDIGIPAEVLFHPELSHTEKLLFGFIRNLAQGKRGCWASNHYLGLLVGVKTWTVSRAITKLVSLQYLDVQYSINSSGKQTRNIYINNEFPTLYHDLVVQAHENFHIDRPIGKITTIVKNHKGPSEKSHTPIGKITTEDVIEEVIEKNTSRGNFTWLSLIEKYGEEQTQFVKWFLRQQKKKWPLYIKEEITPMTPRVLSSLDTIDKLCRIDGFDFAMDIKPILTVALKNNFWSRNLLSLGPLRNKSKTNGEIKFVNVLASPRLAQKMESTPKTVVEQQGWSKVYTDMVLQNIFKPVWGIVGIQAQNQTDITKNIILLLEQIEKRQKRPDYSTSGTVPKPNDPSREQYDRWRLIPDPAGIIVQFLAWLQEQTWIDQIKPHHFEPDNKVFRLFIGDYQQQLGLDVFTGRSLA